jgi:hypothetical protein
LTSASLIQRNYFFARIEDGGMNAEPLTIAEDQLSNIVIALLTDKVRTAQLFSASQSAIRSSINLLKMENLGTTLPGFEMTFRLRFE